MFFRHVLSKCILLSCLISVTGTFALSSNLQAMGKPSAGKLSGEGIGMPTASWLSVSMVSVWV